MVIIPVVFNILLWNDKFNRLIIEGVYIRRIYEFSILIKKFGFIFWVFAISGLIVLWARFIYGLLDIIPIARSVIVQEISTGVIILDNEGRILDINPAARNMINIKSDNPLGKYIDEMVTNIPEVVRLYKEEKKGITEVVLKKDGYSEYYEVSSVNLKIQIIILLGT